MEQITPEQDTQDTDEPTMSTTPPQSTPPPPPLPPDPPAPPPGPHGPPGGWQTPPPPPAADSPRRVLRRDVRHKVLGGVAAGLADYFDIDAVVVRIAFVALTVLGGSGILLYLAGWLLIPADDTDRAVVHDFLERRPRRRSLVAIVLGTVIAIIALSNLFSSGPWWPHWDRGVGGFGFFFGFFALALAAVLLVSSGRRGGSPLRWLLLTTLVAVAAFAVVVVATVFSVEAMSGVPLRGGVGDTQWRPTSAAQVAPNYRLAIGNMRVDLSNVTFNPGTTHVTASVGIGHLVVTLPSGTAVSVTAHSGLGDVQVFGQNDGGFSTSQTMQLSGTSGTSATSGTSGTPAASATSTTAAAPRIVLDAETGVGQVQVIRASP